MKEIILTNEDIETIKMDTEFIHWKCPYCGKKHTTIEWNIIGINELWCNKCHETTKYSWK